LAPGKQVRAWRLRTVDRPSEFIDEIQGVQSQNVYRDVGDFVLLRADGLFAYQFAVVVDDAEQGVSHVVRGVDLLDSTARQIELQRALGLPLVNYAHLPIAVNEAGEKLSKQTRAPALSLSDSSLELIAALQVLGQGPDRQMADAPIAEIWAWAKENWRLDRVPRQRGLAMSVI
jgi:glutamyl-Q tRNA(Asp) synthetase